MTLGINEHSPANKSPHAIQTARLLSTTVQHSMASTFHLIDLLHELLLRHVLLHVELACCLAFAFAFCFAFAGTRRTQLNSLCPGM